MLEPPTKKWIDRIIVPLILIVVGGLVVLLIWGYFTAPKGANLNIENVSYRIRWMGEVDPNTSEILNADRFRVHVFTTVSNSRSADYSAIIYNAEYTIYDGERAVSHWVSNNDQIDILPGDSFLYSDFGDEIHLEHGEYTLRSRIEYKDAKDERTPLEFTATVLIDKIPRYSKIIDNRDW